MLISRDLLEKIKDFEEMEFAGAKRDFGDLPATKLEPLNEGGTSALLNMVGMYRGHARVNSF